MPNEASPTTPVLDEEDLFRSVRDDPQCFGWDANRKALRLSHSSFNDPDKQPSVDRAGLQSSGPQATRFTETDGVVVMTASQVRAVRGLKTCDAKGKALHDHDVDVHHAPEEHNYSHALIKTVPQAVSDGTFKRLKEALCRIAEGRGWAYPPSSLR